MLDRGATIGKAGKKIGIPKHTYYRWRKECGGLWIEQANRLKSLNKENTQLKKLMADLSLDNAMQKEGSEGNF